MPRRRLSSAQFRQRRRFLPRLCRSQQSTDDARHSCAQLGTRLKLLAERIHTHRAMSRNDTVESQWSFHTWKSPLYTEEGVEILPNLSGISMCENPAMFSLPQA